MDSEGFMCEVNAKLAEMNDSEKLDEILRIMYTLQQGFATFSAQLESNPLLKAMFGKKGK